jgi:MFS family permease
VRFLPSTLMIVLIAPLAGRMADRVGPRPLMVTGLSLSAFALFLQTRIGVDTGYELLLPSFMIMGVGMALTMSPMSTAAMNSVTAEKAGAASGILSMSRMVGGTFGVAAIGALFQHLARGRLEDTLSGLPVTSAQREHLVENLGSGSGGHLDGLDPALTAKVATASKDAFIHALASGMWLSAAVAATGAVLAFWLVAPKRAERPEPARTTEAPEPLGV